jgi:hypothetical protein
MDRQELFSVLTDAMLGNEVETGPMGGRVRAGQVKSRVLEVHPPEMSVDGVSSLLDGLARPAGLDVAALSEDLWLLRGNGDAFFVDSLNRRFWLLHSTATAGTVRSLVRRHLAASPWVDVAWLPADQLRCLEGRRRWIKSSFSSDLLQPRDTGELVPRRWRVQVEGEKPEELLELVANSRYGASASLTAVGSHVSEPGIGRVDVAVDYQGGFVSSGTSFELVAGVVWRTLDRYEQYVRSLEDRFRLRTSAVDDLGLTIDGEVAHLDFAHPVSDLEALIANLFTCREPFRLWAVPREVAPREWEADAVDLHVGSSLRLELTERWMRVMLSERTCGNSLARLVANLQHQFDARTQVPAMA